MHYWLAMHLSTWKPTTSTSGSADSEAKTDLDARGIEIRNDSGGLDIEGNAIVAGNVTAELNASAVSVGDDSSDEGDSAEAEAELDGAQGIYSFREPIEVGETRTLWQRRRRVVG